MKLHPPDSTFSCGCFSGRRLVEPNKACANLHLPRRLICINSNSNIICSRVNTSSIQHKGELDLEIFSCIPPSLNLWHDNQATYPSPSIFSDNYATTFHIGTTQNPHNGWRFVFPFVSFILMGGTSEILISEFYHTYLGVISAVLIFNFVTQLSRKLRGRWDTN